MAKLSTKERIAREIRGLREKRNWSRREVARRLGWNHETYRQKEAAILAATGAELAEIARVYGLQVRDAFPSYEPTKGERLLAEQLGEVA